ncbi:GNAT family N-acetyltransferase [Nocardia wallacei]|uniref:GNAT family N-acetyltransferase n=1 Tax=Nocardia wallacei TaxID=480035 RepID=UPI002454AF6C|nr:GNAT family N-acetyltransferase [Nocardia wallacei]
MSGNAVRVQHLQTQQWPDLRDIRLRALADAPHAFGATLREAQARTELQWRARLVDRTQFLATVSSESVGVVAVALDPDPHTAHLMSMWVDPAHRGGPVADALIQAVIDRATTWRCTRLRLEITNGNHRAENAYARHGFARTGRNGPLDTDQSRSEFGMALTLTSTPPSSDPAAAFGVDSTGLARP